MKPLEITPEYKAITGQLTGRLGTVKARNSDVSWDEVRAS